MNLTTRALGLSLLLLLLFMGATLALQGWLARETRHLHREAVEEQRARLARALETSPLKPDQRDAAYFRELGTLLGCSLQLLKPDEAAPAAAKDAAELSFALELPDSPGGRVLAQFGRPALLRVQVLHQRTLIAMVLLSLLVSTVPLLLVLVGSRQSVPAESGMRSPWTASRAQAFGLEHFAKISHERTAALAEEHGARVRAEENLQVNRNLLDLSLAERVRLGRELHDNICQTLYAVCLTLESVQKKNTLAPALQQRVDQCMAELRRLNQEVRSYLQDLEPARVSGLSFAGAVADMTGAFMAGEKIKIEHRLDEEAVALIPPHQTADIINILREAVSNSLRHGHARHITLLAGRNEGEVALAVQDDGTGFTASPGRTGHGLTNMQARATALGGELRVESSLGKGTRVLLTLPVASPG